MSWLRCDRCGDLVNSDNDPDCFVEKPNYDNTAHPVNPAWTSPVEYECICEPCRETLIEDMERENFYER